MNAALPPTTAAAAAGRVDYRTDPGQYRHWTLTVNGPVARLALDIAEDSADIVPGERMALAHVARTDESDSQGLHDSPPSAPCPRKTATQFRRTCYISP